MAEDRGMGNALSAGGVVCHGGGNSPPLLGIAFLPTGNPWGCNRGEVGNRGG